jgi:hypothetical protein
VSLSVKKLLLIIVGLGTSNVTHDSSDESDDDGGSENNGVGTPLADEDDGRAYGWDNNNGDVNRGGNDIDDDAGRDFDPMDTEDDNGRPNSPQAGQKRPRCDSDPAQPEPDINEFRKAIKEKNSRGKPKADDWELDVQEILAKAIVSYETRLATQGLFPDHMEEVTWAKMAWLDGCRDCGLKIHHNSELIKIVSFILYQYLILMKHAVSLRIVERIFAVS